MSRLMTASAAILLATCCCAMLIAEGVPKFGERTCLVGSELTYAVGQLGCGVAIVDWNGDGLGDIVAANQEGEVFVILARPAGVDPRWEDARMIGKFPTRYPGADPVIMGVADHNQDGKLDVFLRDRFGQHWLLAGEGPFKLGEAKPQGEPTPDYKRPAEFPRTQGRLADEKDEATLIGRPGVFHVYPLEMAATPEPRRIAGRGFAMHGRSGFDPNLDVIDFDGDGLLDLLTVGFAREPGGKLRSVLLYRNIGTKTEPRFAEAQALSNEVDIHNVLACADLDGDGKLDLLLCRTGAWMLWNEGTNKAPKFARKVKVPVIRDEEHLNLVDFDGDGKLDLVGGRWHDADHKAHVSFYRNRTEKPRELAFDEPVEILFGGRPVAFMNPSVHVVDFDGDGDLDIVSGSYGGEIRFMENTAGKGSAPVFATPVPVTDAGGPIRAGGRNTAIHVSDLNGDGKLDLLFTTEYAAFDIGKEILVWYGQ